MLGDADGLPGLYGKLPGRGDFVRRRLPLGFVKPWDGWLQAAMVASREALESRWLDIYLTSPLWRFALSAGLCGETAATGVVLPSVDSVQRCFPLSIAALLPSGATLFQLPAQGHDWFARIENLALSCLEPGTVLADLDERLEAIGPPPVADPGPPAGLSGRGSRDGICWRFDEDILPCIGGFYPRALDDLARSAYGPFSLWWTDRSDRVPPSFLLYRSLPPVADFSGMLGEAAGSVSDATCPLADEAGR